MFINEDITEELLKYRKLNEQLQNWNESNEALQKKKYKYICKTPLYESYLMLSPDLEILC